MNPKRPRRPDPTTASRRLRPLALAAAALFVLPPGQAAGPAALPSTLPSGLQVVQGQATLAGSANRLTVSNSANAILNWQQFSIGAGNTVHFAQPGVASKVLNRVVGNDPSQIFGSLTSNGQVWLLNPNGVLFGQAARVDVAGLVASTLRLGDADWQAGRFSLVGSAGGVGGAGGAAGALTSASVVNQGEIRTVNGGRVLLIGSGSVHNQGLIDAPDGQVLLAAGRSVELVDTGLPNLSVGVTAPQGEAVNLGTIGAGGGRIDLQAAMVNQQGIVRADSLGHGRGGAVLLAGAQGVQLGAGSLTSADGASGGAVMVDGGIATTLVAGRVSALGSDGLGGDIALLGRQVGLQGSAVVDASGAAGGGAVRAGGGLQGRDAAYRNADALYMAPGAVISADATRQGDGGLVVLWSDRATRVYGSLNARGGALGGNGGFIETSGHWLDARPLAVRSSAPAGRAGQWLIDPDDLLITDDTSDRHITGNPDFSTTGDSARLSTDTLAAALNANNNVTVTTGAGGEGYGDITMSGASLTVNPTSPVRLTLNAIGDIAIRGSTVASDGAALSLKLVAGHLGGQVGLGDASTSDGGAVAVESSLIRSRGGDISIGGNSVACGSVTGCSTANTGAVASSASRLFDGIAVIDSTLDAGAGRISLAGHSLVRFTDTHGVLLSGSTLTGRSIDLLGTVDSGGNVGRTGVAVIDSTVAATDRLSITGAAYSDTYRLYPRLIGVDLQGESELRIGSAVGTPGAQMTVRGSVQDMPLPGNPSFEVGALPRYGVALRGYAKLVAQGGAAVDISGDDLASNGDIGVLLASSASAAVDASGASQLTVRSAGKVLITGELKAPEGGQLVLQAGDTLSIDDARVSGNAAEVTLAAGTLDIGGGTSTTQLVFGDATRIRISAVRFNLGVGGAVDLPVDDPGPTQEAVARPPGGVAAQRQVLSVRPLFFTVPEASTALAAGGAIGVAADEVEIGPDATLHSAAAGDAIKLQGHMRAGNVSSFVNQGGSSALSAPNGRWLLYARDSDDPQLPFVPGGLMPAFFQYAAGQPGPDTLPSSQPRSTPGLKVIANAQASADAPVVAGTVPAQGGNGFLFASTPEISLSRSTSLRKTYDGGTAFDFSRLDIDLVGLKPGDRLVGDPHFADKNVGQAKPLQLALAPGGNAALTSGGLPVYGYRIDGTVMVASITPAPLTLAGASVADKRYDGGTAATVSAWTLGGVIAGDELRVQDGSAAFGNAQVGSAKPVRAAVTGLGGADAGNYSIAGLQVDTSAAITPAPLLYLADAASVPRGQALPALSGSVNGFVAGESLATATTGALRFDSPAGTDSPAGRYAINGSGLTAANYSLAQAAANATALTVLAPPPALPDFIAPPVNAFVTQDAVDAVLMAAQGTAPDRGRALDALPAVLAGGGNQPGFDSLDLDQLSPAAVAAVLAARDEFKKTLFRQALEQLEQDPTRADAVGCASAQQAASGQCLITTTLVNGLAISNARVVDLASGSPVVTAVPEAPRPALAGAPPTTTTTATATAPAPADAPALAVAPARQAALAPRPPVPVVDLPARRSIKSASLPQIQRKVAVVIGIDRYSDARIPRLSNAVADARAVAAALESQLGYQTVVLENANRSGIFRALNQLVGQVGPADSVVLYYAGHGERAEKSGLGYWQPADADPTRPETWISNADIDRLMKQLPASQVAMISDSCFSGSLVSGERIRGAPAGPDAAALLDRRAAVVMTSGGNEPVFDSGKNGHSPFAWSLMQSLQQVSSWKPGSSVFEQVRFAVARQLPQRPQYAAAPNAGHQSGGDYVFEQRQLGGVVK